MVHVTRELGADRRDWGGLATLYFRTIEVEVRKRIEPLVNRLQEVGACESKEMTLGRLLGGFAPLRILKSVKPRFQSVITSQCKNYTLKVFNKTTLFYCDISK